MLETFEPPYIHTYKYIADFNCLRIPSVAKTNIVNSYLSGSHTLLQPTDPVSCFQDSIRDDVACCGDALFVAR